MKTNKYNIIIIICLLLFIVCLFTICKRKKEIITEKTTIDTVYIKTHKTDTMKVTIPYYVKVKVPDSIQVKVTDSAYCMELAKQLYTKNIYKRNLINDSNLTVNLTDTVTQNKLGHSIIDYKIKERFITKTIEKTIIQQPKPLSFQIQVTTSFNDLNVMGGIFIKNTGIIGGYDIMGKKGIVGASIKF